MIRITSLKLLAAKGRKAHDTDALQALLRKKVMKCLRLRDAGAIRSLMIARHGIDARNRREILDVYHVDVALAGGVSAEEKLVKRLRNANVRMLEPVSFSFPAAQDKASGSGDRPLVVGMGPAGLFAAYALAEHGYRPVLIERGREAAARVRDVRHFWETGALHPQSNVQFGEGGAGTFSDGKLYTSLKDREGYFAEILRIFAAHGADKDILYEAHPHIGTDRLVEILQSMRERMLARGAEIRFETRLTGLLTEPVRGLATKEDRASGSGEGHAQTVVGIRTDKGEEPCTDVILAIGHSARDTYEMLYGTGVAMEAKPFAAGLRIAHPQRLVNEAMYGIAEPWHLPPAPYKLTATTPTGRSVYSFCMCPGGFIINASSEEGRLCVNGMSYADRGGRYANSAIVTTLTPEEILRVTASERASLPHAEALANASHAVPDVLAGIAFQRRLEERAFAAGAGKIPVSSLSAFVSGKEPEEALSFAHADCFRGGIAMASLRGILPEQAERAILEGIRMFDRTIPGFAAPDAVLACAETRTSAPVRILRDAKSLESVNVAGLYPCGEGAGYAGGIMSAAADGLRCARMLAGKRTASRRSCG